LRDLSRSQRSTILDVQRGKGVEVGIVGVDAVDLPVIWVRDTRRTFVMAVQRNGAGRDPALPVRWFSDEEIQQLPVQDAESLFSLPPKHTPTQEVAS